jgi:hypothetical protein
MTTKSQTIERLAECIFDAQVEAAIDARTPSSYYREIEVRTNGTAGAFESEYFDAIPEAVKESFRERAALDMTW